MCSTSPERIAEIGQAIEELASEVLASYGNRPATSGPADRTSDANQIAIRLAELWSQLAELDPEVARRLPTYEA
jgi:predicted trehalose synthase